MVEGRGTRWLLRIATALVLGFIYFPLVIVTLYAFNANITQSWPIQDWTTKWFSVALHDEDVRAAFLLSVKAALLATAVALVLGTLLAFAMSRFDFFGRNALSFLVVLPIALPGNHHRDRLERDDHDSTAAARHQLRARDDRHRPRDVLHRRSPTTTWSHVSGGRPRTVEEASTDLGADTWTTFRRVILPAMGTALLAGGLLAFGLSFDEVIVTVFTSGSDQTLPIWIFTNLARPQQLPVINVVAFVVVLISIIPVYAAQRLVGPAEGEEAKTVGVAAP